MISIYTWIHLVQLLIARFAVTVLSWIHGPLWLAWYIISDNKYSTKNTVRQVKYFRHDLVVIWKWPSLLKLSNDRIWHLRSPVTIALCTVSIDPVSGVNRNTCSHFQKHLSLRANGKLVKYRMSHLYAKLQGFLWTQDILFGRDTLSYRNKKVKNVTFNTALPY